jgi:hypothetical protein
MKDKIIENSLILAEFMGIKPIKGFDEETKKEYYYYNNAEHQDFEALPNYTDYEDLMPIVDKILKSKFKDNGVFYSLKTFRRNNAYPERFMVRFQRHELFQSETQIEALYLAVVDCVKGITKA